MKLPFASLAVLAALALPITAAAQAPPAGSAKTAADKPITFDVVSVKPNKTGSTDMGLNMNPDGLTGRNVQLHMLVLMAYQIHDDQLLNEPKWADTDGWDIDARIAAEDMATLGTLTFSQRLSMMQAILTDRFGLKVHRETRQLPVYTLVVAKGGEKMKASKVDPDQPMIAGIPGRFSSHRGKSATITASMATMDGLADMLSDSVGRKVLDSTGLTGRYDFSLQWTPDEDITTGATPDPAAPSIFAAVEDQLGLKLVSTKGPVPVVVIDAIAKPSEN